MNAVADDDVTFSEEPAPPARPEPTRTAVIDAVSRVVARRGPGAMRWSAIAREAGDSNMTRAWSFYGDMPALVDECYSRAAQGLEQSLLRAETAGGNGLDKLAVFLVAAFEIRRERGSLLSFRPAASEELPPAQRRRLRERDLMIRTRLKRLLMKGQQDGSLARRNVDCACALVLTNLQPSAMNPSAEAQRTWDAEYVEMLLAALADPNVGETWARET
ncbi:MAG TPA: hypothetical protein VLW26_00795 [Steroidobacteraceae bacterium]|nr:hypothetical protein [Steroidobacteraceae bacterium]